MKTARFIDIGKIEIKEEPNPVVNDIKQDELIIKVKASGICGTDHHIYTGDVTGLVNPGTVLGHEFSGIIEGIGSGVNPDTFNIGDNVAVEPNLFCGACHYCRNAKKHFCENWSAIGLSQDGGFEEYCVIPMSAAYKMPKGLSHQNAAFFEPTACVLHGCERAKILPGETVVVQGAGSIGLIYVQVLKMLGASVIVSDIVPEKLALAKQMGADMVINAQTENLVDIVKSMTDGIGAQVLIDAAGLLSTIPTSFELLENTGRVVIFGVPPEGKKVEITPFEIYRHEIQIIGSFTNPYTNEAALKLLKDIDIDPIVTNKITLDGLVDKGLDLMGQKDVLKVQIQF